MTGKSIFQFMVVGLSVLLFLLLAFILIPWLLIGFGIGQDRTGGIGIVAGGVSWSFLRTLVIFAFLIFLVVVVLLWRRIARHDRGPQ